MHINNQAIFNQKAIEAGITKVGQILDEDGNFKPYLEVNRMSNHGIPYLLYF